MMEICSIFIDFGFFLLMTTLQGTAAMRDARISVPSAVVRGDDAVLECTFDLEGDQLYAVKWYLGTTEFYRYTPKEIPPIKQFPTQSGLIVRESHSSANRVVLEHVPISISGRYSCEVSADAPGFYTSYQSAHLQVVDLPKSDPHISGVKTRYHYGEVLKANCTAGHSNPPVNLTWMINAKQAERSYFHNHKERTHDGQYTSQSTLRLKIVKELFNPRLKIRCVASMFNIYYRSNEKSIEAGKKRHAHHYAPPSAGTTHEPARQLELEVQEEPRPETTLVLPAPNDDGSGTKTFRPVVLLVFLVSAVFR